MTTGIGAQDGDLPVNTTHYHIVDTGGTYAAAIRGANEMRRRAFRTPVFMVPVLTSQWTPRISHHDGMGADPIHNLERKRGIPAW